MSVKLHKTTEFSALVNQLQQAPENPELKRAVLRRLPEMKALAQNSPIALYRLAQVFHQSSPQYEDMMRQAAKQGCTNAMLAMCDLLLKSKLPTSIEQAFDYADMINKSQDSYIIQQSKNLLAEYPEVQNMMKGPKEHMGNYRFFAAQQSENSVDVANETSLVI